MRGTKDKLLLLFLFTFMALPAMLQSAHAGRISVKTAGSGRADSIIAYAKTLIGTPYHYAGKTKTTGFDCSGFTSFVYGHFGISISPASAEQAYVGKQIPLSEAKKGDLLIFTGTNSKIRKAGHVGIVISEPGEPLQFIHCSSGPAHGITVTAITEASYTKRFLQVRRLIP